MKRAIEFLTTFIPFLNPYPSWVKTIIAIWIIFFAAIIVILIFTYPTRMPKQALQRKEAAEIEDKESPTKNQTNIGKVEGDYVAGNKYVSELKDKGTTQQIETLNRKIDILLEQQEKYLKQQYNLQAATGKLLSPETGRKGEPYRINFGTNIFTNTPDILVVDGIPLVTMAVKDNRLLVSATIYSKEGKILCLIKDNEWVSENKTGLRKESTINSLKVWDDKNRLILDVAILSDRLIKLNGIFYKKGAEIIATDEGLRINSKGTSVGLGGS